MDNKTKKVTMVGMLCAVAFLVTVVCRIPVVLFLKYEPKDVVISIGGFLFGPMTAFVISVIVSFVEMFTISDTGFIGLIMNVLAMERELVSPTEEEIREYLAGNLCRCTGYMGQMRAIEKYLNRKGGRVCGENS